jgi:hypothetical protein
MRALSPRTSCGGFWVDAAAFDRFRYVPLRGSGAGSPTTFCSNSPVANKRQRYARATSDIEKLSPVARAVVFQPPRHNDVLASVRASMDILLLTVD